MSDLIRIEPFENDYLNRHIEDCLIRPANEFLCRPQKHIRSELVRVGAGLSKLVPKLEDAGHGESVLEEDLERLCRVVEVIHSGSLIVDDIQDGSYERRQGPCLHDIQGVGLAINTGSWLYFWALREIGELKTERKARLVDLFIDLMYQGHLGQAFDLGKPVSMIPRCHVSAVCWSSIRRKTGIFTGSCLQAGALLSGREGNDDYRWGQEFGIILQIIDDIKNLRALDRTDTCGKSLEDLRNMRPSFLWAFADTVASDEDYQQLIEIVGNRDGEVDTDAVANWLQTYDFFASGMKMASKKMAELKGEMQASSNGPNLVPHFIELYNKLVQAYERTEKT